MGSHLSKLFIPRHQDQIRLVGGGGQEEQEGRTTEDHQVKKRRQVTMSLKAEDMPDTKVTCQYTSSLKDVELKIDFEECSAHNV
jgi:hypothetical protein